MGRIILVEEGGGNPCNSHPLNNHSKVYQLLTFLWWRFWCCLGWSFQWRWWGSFTLLHFGQVLCRRMRDLFRWRLQLFLFSCSLKKIVNRVERFLHTYKEASGKSRGFPSGRVQLYMCCTAPFVFVFLWCGHGKVCLTKMNKNADLSLPYIMGNFRGVQFSQIRTLQHFTLYRFSLCRRVQASQYVHI